MEAIRQAIMHGAEAGKLRAFVRENGGEMAGFRGLQKLSERHSSMANRLLAQVARETVAE